MSPAEEPANKRRRIALACNACRTRKSRCDGKRPNCGACVQSSLECVYEASESSTNVIVAKEYVADLETRLRKMERALQRHDDLLTGHLSSCGPVTATVTSRASITATAIDEPNNLDSYDDDEDFEETDGLAIRFVDEQDPVYFGESSTIRFVRVLTDSLSAIWNVSRPENPSTPAAATANGSNGAASSKKRPSMHEAQQQQTPRQSVAEASELPSGDDMEDMLRLFFNTTGVIFPVMHEPTFWMYYSKFKASGYTKIGRPWLGMLNMMFAMATNVGSAGERLDKSLVYYHRAVALCGSFSLKVVSIESVLYLLLQVLYLQGTPRSSQAWNIHGLLVRSALALGLHADRPYSNPKVNAIDREMRRRTWSTIYCLDKVLSGTFGRPCAVPNHYMTTDCHPRDWSNIEHLKTTTKETKSMQQRTEFMSVSLNLYVILGRCLAEQYDDNLGREAHDSVSDRQMIRKARNLSDALDAVRLALKPDMFLVRSGGKELKDRSDKTRMRILLTLRFHNLSIMIHRPLVCLVLQHLSKGRYLSKSVSDVLKEAQLGIESAEETIGIVHDALGASESHGHLGVWFFTLHYGKQYHYSV